jgi:ADP-ribose pyrophosphatase YjhB (NUDIX family)
MLRTEALGHALSIRIVAEPEMAAAAEVEKEVDDLWTAAEAAGPSSLFNGPMLSFVALREGTLEARLTDYRHVLAQKRAPHLYEALRIRPLAVSGLVRHGSRVVFGKRAGYTTQDAGRWELVPSGGLTPRALDAGGNISAETQVLQELQEELGVAASVVESVRPFLLVEDLDAHVIEVGFEITLAASQSDLEQATSQRSDEYAAIEWVETSELARFCDPGAHDVIAVSRALLAAKGWLD